MDVVVVVVVLLNLKTSFLILPAYTAHQRLCDCVLDKFTIDRDIIWA